MRYEVKLVSTNSNEQFEKEVAAYLNDNWDLYGQPYCITTASGYGKNTQLMIRKVYPENRPPAPKDRIS